MLPSTTKEPPTNRVIELVRHEIDEKTPWACIEMEWRQHWRLL